MKTFFISIGIGVLVVAVSVFYTYRLEKVSENLVMNNRALIEALENDDFEKSEILTDEMEEYINKKKTVLAVVVDHEDLDKIEFAVAELKGYVQYGVKADAVSKCTSLDVLLRHMPKNYKLKVENVL